MSAIKKTVSISEKLVKEAGTITSNFSSIVEAALIDYLHQYRIKQATKSFGQWKDRTGNSVDFVNDLRKNDDRECIKGKKNAKKTKK